LEAEPSILVAGCVTVVDLPGFITGNAEEYWVVVYLLGNLFIVVV